MRNRWTKKQRRELRELQGLAWERELGGALQDLRRDFESWERGEISAFELSDRMHKFHNGRSRELYNLYSSSLDHFFIDHAIVRGVIDESELSDELREEVKDDIARSRERFQAMSQN